MDLRDQSSIKTIYTYDENDDALTITFKTEDEVTTLGTIIIDGKNFLALNDSMKQIISELFFNRADLSTQRTVFNKQTLKGTVNFDSV